MRDKASIACRIIHLKRVTGSSLDVGGQTATRAKLKCQMGHSRQVTAGLPDLWGQHGRRQLMGNVSYGLDNIGVPSEHWKGHSLCLHGLQPTLDVPKISWCLGSWYLPQPKNNLKDWSLENGK